jgi:CIC family chloride channel protein
MAGLDLLKPRSAYVLATVLVALAAAGFAILFRMTLAAAEQTLLGSADVLEGFRGLTPALRLVVPAVGGFVAGLFGILAARRAGGHGVAEILEAVALGRGRISVATNLWKAAGSLSAIAAGGSLGREGSIVQFGGASGQEIGHRFGIDAKGIRALVAAGTAAGFAAAYNTPIAAILFVVEIVTGIISLDFLVPVVVATTIATGLTRLTIGGGPLYGARAFQIVSDAELAAYLVLGGLAGAVGPLFMAALSAGERAFRALSLPRPLRGALGGLGVGLIALALPQVAGNGFEAIQLILDARVAGLLLLALLLAKAVATVSSVSSGSPGGVFTPSLFLGAALGGVVGSLVQLVAASGVRIFTGGYALVGMAAVIAATTHAPLMAAVLVFELSGDYPIVLPLLLATTVATLVSRRLRRDSIYTEELRRRGIPWEGTLAQRLARAVKAKDILEMDPPEVAADAPLDEALARLERGRARVVYVVGAGALRAIDLHFAKTIWAARARGAQAHAGAAAGAVAAPVVTAAPDESLLSLAEKLWTVDWGEVPVVADGSPPRILGVVTRRAVLGAFDRELLQRDVLFTRVVWFEGQRESADYLELPTGHRVEIVAPPGWLVGKNVDPTDLRRRFHLTLVAVRRDADARGGPPTWMDADIDYAVQAGDRLMVIGTLPEIEEFRLSRG